MTTVDLAFLSVLRHLNGPEVTYWRLWDQAEWKQPPGGSTAVEDAMFLDEGSGLHYRLLRGNLEEVYDADCVVYWGDFLHMAVYQRHMAHVLSHRIGAENEEDAARTVAEHLMLRGQPTDRLNRTLSYGTTLSFNTAADYASPYGEDLRRFHEGVRRVWHRDLYSAHIASVHRGPGQVSCKGTDAAFLLEAGEDGTSGDSVGVFIGRSELRPEAIARFSRELSRRRGLRPRWIPWGHEPAFWPMGERRRFRAAWPELAWEASDISPGQWLSAMSDVVRRRGQPASVLTTTELLDQVQSCAIVITDTYHLAVNAWRLGVPAVCITDHPTGAWTVNAGESSQRRDKREDLYSQIEALRLLVDGSTLSMRSGAEVRRICEALDDGDLLATVRNRVASMATNGHQEVVSAIRSCLERR